MHAALCGPLVDADVGTTGLQCVLSRGRNLVLQGSAEPQCNIAVTKEPITTPANDECQKTNDYKKFSECVSALIFHVSTPL